jgi:Xaa-Pro aminopeptidase
MKKTLSLSLLVLIFLMAPVRSSAQSHEEYSARRGRVINSMSPGSIMILRSPQSSDMFDYTKRGGYFYYLTGIDEPGCTLVIFSKDFKLTPKSASPIGEILFIHPLNADRVNWDALTIGIDGAKIKSKISDVRPASETMDYIGQLLARNFSVLYMDIKKSGSVISPLTEDEQLIKQARDHGSIFEIQDPSALLAGFVAKKSPAEIELMRKVVRITATAQKEAMRSITADMYEYQLDAVIRYIFSVNGAVSVSFPTIVGSGINSVILHWMENSHRMENGDMVVVDCGAEKELYCADITRTYPVSGKFTERQKNIYQIVLEANEEAIRRIKPGIRMNEVSSVADSVLAAGMLRIGLIRDKSEFRKYYYHGLSHHIGLKDTFGGALDVLEPGMIITIEPGIYVREEKTGVRIEDDVLVTETGYEVLSGEAPKQVAEIEKGMKEEGMEVTGKVLK